MTEPGHGPDPARRARDLTVAAAAVLLIVGCVVTLHGPSVALELTGDSYQWVQHAHAAAHRPLLLLADLDTFFRPAATWSLVVDRLVWGGFDARGYRTSSVAWHALVAVLLFVVGRRLGLGPLAASLVALVWATSPYTDESAFVVAPRHQPQLMAAWLVLAWAWPRAHERWSPGRVAVSVVAILASMAAKETWVVTPALVAALEAGRRPRLRDAAVPVGLVSLAVLGYLAWYLTRVTRAGSYFELGAHVATKIPHQLAVFLYLDEPMVFDPRLTWQGVVACVVVAAVAWAVMRWRVPGVWFALALLLLPTIPTLAVPYLPQRFLAIPYAGFLLLLALWADALARRVPRLRLAVVAVGVGVGALVMLAGASLVRADLEDYRAMAAAHGRLVDEARRVADTVTIGQPVLVVRDETSQPLVEILRDPRGLPKLPFSRHDDPYGLIDTAALFEWVVAAEGTRVERVDDWRSRCVGAPGRVLVHRDGGFDARGVVVDVAAEASRWQAAGRRVRVIRAVALD